MKIIYFLSLLFFTVLAKAQNRDLAEIKGWIAIDSNSSWNTANLKNQPFTPLEPDSTINIGYNKNATIWCRFIVKNKDQEKSINTWLCFNNNHIDSLVFYEHDRVVKILGDRTNQSSAFINVMAYEINLKPGEEKSYVVRVKKELSYLDFTYYLGNKAQLEQQSTTKIAIISFLLGIIFLLIIFNSILFYISRKILFFYYILHSALGTMYVAITTNYIKHLMLKDFLYFSEFRIYVSFIWVICLTAFFCHYIDIRKFHPLKYRAINTLNAINILNITVTLVLLCLKQYEAIKPLMIIGYLTILSTISIILWATILHLKVDKNSAAYILLAFLPNIVWTVCFILKLFKLIAYDASTDWLVIINLYEVFLFGYVLTKNYMDTFVRNNTLIQEIVIEKEKSLETITQTQIRERRNIANIIHDNFGSKIAYILQLLQLKNVSRADAHMKELASEIREISHRILPKSLDEGALISSLESQIESLNAGLPNSKIELFHYDFPEKLNEVWIYDLYLIALEIINNALKHGLAESVDIELYLYTDHYLFQFTDDGIGFNTLLTKRGFGLESIEKRVLYYNGTFEINSGNDQGTIIQISIPKKSK